MPIVTNGTSSYVETFSDCERCARGCNEPRDRSRQASRRCTMTSEGTWDPVGSAPYVHMGGQSDDEDEPAEDNEDGCPGGWYRCGFVWSLHRYLRPSADGVYSENLSLSRCDDRLVLDAVAYFEVEQSRWRAWSNDLIQRRN